MTGSADPWFAQLAQALSGGTAVEAVILVLLLEMLLLMGWHWRTGRGLPAAALLPNLAAGLCLMLALRNVLADQHPGWTAMALLGAGLAHATDLRQRWHQAQQRR